MFSFTKMYVMYARRDMINIYFQILLFDFSPHAVTRFRHVTRPAKIDHVCECKLYRVIFLLIPSIQDVVSSCRRKPIKLCSSDEGFVMVV